MTKEAETSSPDAEETATLSDTTPEQDKIISISDDSPMTAIMLQQGLRNLEREHMSWVRENPRKTGFDPRVIKIRIIKHLLMDKRANLDQIARQIIEAYGDVVTRQCLDNTWEEVRTMLNKWNE